MSDKKKLIIIDGYGFVFRAYHVQPKLSAPDGAPVGAVYGFTSMLLKVLNDFKDTNYGVVVFDTGGKNFRHEIYPDYKAHRPPVPEDLIPQFSQVRLAAQGLNFPILEQDGFEADDIIATLSRTATQQGWQAIIISSDKDLMQLVSDDIQMYDPIKAKYITREEVIKKFGVPPEKVRDMLSLMGDKSDNIPGVPGVGPKTALDLINQFSSFQNIFRSAQHIKNLRIRQLIIDSQDKVAISYELTGLNDFVDINLDLELLALKAPDINLISEFLYKNGFKSLSKRVESLFNIKLVPQHQEGKANEELAIININTVNELNILYKKSLEAGIIAFQLIETPKFAAFIITLKEQCYVINLTQNVNVPQDLFSYNDKSKTMPFTEISQLISDPSIKKITYGLKGLLKFLQKDMSINFAAFEDLELMIYSISAGLKQENMFGKYDPSLTELEIINTTCKIVKDFENKYNLLSARLLEERALYFYKDIDLPLCYLLNQMEQEGVKIETNKLKILSEEFGAEIKILEKEIYIISGEEFNIGSPKQLGEILFNKMGLPFAKSSAKSNNFLTGVEILEKLSKEGYKIADLLLSWRMLSKLKTTYTDALPNYINPKTCRIHTSLLQTSTTTSRLSSQDPNLQNIPIRSLEGNKIREVFIAEAGHELISADYSQIELRILAHIASVESLKQTFSQNVDIHTATAAQIFGIKKEEVTGEHRRKAKAINFGIIYGISAFGLAKQLDISNNEAAEYIKRYFEEFPAIKEYMEKTKLYAGQHGYVNNLLGRRCYVPQISEKNHNLKQNAERAAINAPIQGSNAEIIKIAMLNIDKKIKELKLKTKMILQIHDELLFEAPMSEVEMIKPLIKNIMENSYVLGIPLIVEIKSGNNWQEIH